jgi:NADH-quinone oxidoreductase subunit M
LIEEYGGLGNVMPVFTGVFGIIALASAALPTLSGFVGEFLVLVGTYTSRLEYARTYTVLAATAMVLSAVYLLWTLQRILFGEVTKEENRRLPDLSLREMVVLVPMVILVIVMGVLPNPILRRTDRAVEFVTERLSRGGQIAEDGTRMTRIGRISADKHP